MKTILKFLKWIGIILFIGLIAGIAYLKFALPNVGEAPEMKVELTPERIERGKYLANHITVCIDCHSERDWTKFSAPLVEGTIGKGGDVFNQKLGFPGEYYASNITPYGISKYTDGELFRVITTGVKKDGKAAFPIMPYHYYGRMDEEDIKSIIAYLRTLSPIENDVPESKSDFPMNLIINTIPKKAELGKRPPITNFISYGNYITNAAGCMECHTQSDKGVLIEGAEFGGGREFLIPNGSIVRSSNITPDKETGIGTWTEAIFVERFKSRSDSATLNTTLSKDEFNTVMPWTMYGKMTEEDLKAIYAYLKTVKPIKNSVEIYSTKK